MQCRRRRRCHAVEINACHAIRLPSKPCAEGEAIMITVPELAADALGTFLASYMQRRYGRAETRLVELVPSIARIALECIGNSDALYHNVEHTMLVTLVGYDIMKGRTLLRPTYASDVAHLLVACLLHDIGYVRGILSGDGEDGYVVDTKGKKVKLPRGSSDAALQPHHVERSKLFVFERVGKGKQLDAERIANAIEFTRFPSHQAVDGESEEGELMRAADLTDLYPQFYWNSVSPHIQSAIRYLNLTSSGRQWVANLYSNVFRAERDLTPCGPQR